MTDNAGFLHDAAAQPDPDGEFTALFHRFKSAFAEDELLAVLRGWDRWLRRYPKAWAAYGAYYNRAVVLRLLGIYDAACCDLERALQLKPDFAAAEKALGELRLLLSGNRDGWAQYRARLKDEPPLLPIPYWDGTQRGRVYVYAEQGIGDNIHFFRYVQAAKQAGIDMVVQNHAALNSLLDFNLARHGIGRIADGAAEVAAQAGLMDLPYLLNLPHIPHTDGYIQVPPERAQQWRQRFSGSRRFRVGVAWQSVSRSTNAHYRNIDLTVFARLFACDAEFHCLQKQILPQDVQAVCAAGVRLWSGDLHDFADTAALIGQLDLVVCVDTAVAHLAGAMGRPVWLLLPFSPDFRWLDEGSRSVWYDSMTVFRQHAIGDWQSVLDTVSAALVQAAVQNQAA